jgi:phage portal protein BeeE
LLAAAQNPPTFSIDADSIDPAVFGLPTYSSPVAHAARIDRRSAMQVPAVVKSRNLIVSTLGTLPVDLYGPDHRRSTSALLEQPERGIPRSVTLARTFEDLLFEGVAWWYITEYGWHTFPTKVRRLNPRSVSVSQEGRVYTTRGGATGHAVEWLEDADLIRFDSPNDALLVTGARAIRTALTLDAAAQRYADGAPPLDYFTPAQDADPADDTEIVEILTAWQTARQSRATGYVPAALQYNVAGWSPEQLQMADARQHAVLEIARVAGVDPEDLGVPTTSRTYFNAQDRKQARIQDTLRAYMVAFEERISMPDVTPRGYTARFNLTDILRSDDLTRFQSYEVGLRVGALTEPEIREAEGKPALDGSAPAPAAMPQEAPANG